MMRSHNRLRCMGSMFNTKVSSYDVPLLSCYVAVGVSSQARSGGQ
jgi:hypothetical protein